MRPTAALLVRIVIAKIKDTTRLRQVLSRVMVVQESIDWNCKSWVRDALRALEADGKCLGTARTDWSTVEAKAYWYIGLKKDQRLFETPGFGNRLKAPTYDLLLDRETVK